MRILRGNLTKQRRRIVKKLLRKPLIMKMIRRLKINLITMKRKRRRKKLIPN
jgi:hypothetical protein